MSSGSRAGRTSAMVLSTTPAGTISQTARGFSSFLTRSTSEAAPTAFSLANSVTAVGDMSKTTHSWPPFSNRRTMLAPIRPRPTIPSCISWLLFKRGSRRFFELAVVADQRIRRTVVAKLALCFAVEFGDDAQSQHLAELDAPLVERVDVPDCALGKDAVLVHFVETIEHRTKVIRADGDHGREADR